MISALRTLQAIQPAKYFAHLSTRTDMAAKEAAANANASGREETRDDSTPKNAMPTLTTRQVTRTKPSRIQPVSANPLATCRWRFLDSAERGFPQIANA